MALQARKSGLTREAQQSTAINQPSKLIRKLLWWPLTWFKGGVPASAYRGHHFADSSIKAGHADLYFPAKVINTKTCGAMQISTQSHF